MNSTRSLPRTSRLVEDAGQGEMAGRSALTVLLRLRHFIRGQP